jgi:hypothetical protein
MFWNHDFIFPIVGGNLHYTVFNVVVYTYTLCNIYMLQQYCGDIHIPHCSVLRSTSEQRSVTLLLSLSRQQNGPFVAPASETKSAGHAYQLCKPSNGRTERTEGTSIKGGLPEPHSSMIGEAGCQIEFSVKTASD